MALDPEIGSSQSVANVGSEDNQVAALQTQLTNEKERRGEERFMWAVAVVVFFDCIVFPDFDTWTGPLVIGVMELVGLVVLASKCGVDPIMPMLTKVTDAIGSRRDNV